MLHVREYFPFAFERIRIQCMHNNDAALFLMMMICSMHIMTSCHVVVAVVVVVVSLGLVSCDT